MGKQLDLLHKLMLDKEINRKERDMLIALKAFDFEDSNIISVGLQTLLDYFCIKNKKAIYSVLKTLQDKKYIRIEKNDGKKNIYVIIKDYLLSNNSEESRYTDVSTKEESRYADVTANSQDSYADVSSYAESRYTDVSTRKEGRYIDVTSNSQDSYADVPSYAESRYTDLPSDDQGRYNNVSTSRNNINNNNIYNNKIYINIINHWNSKRIGEVVGLNIKIIESINKAMAKYSFDEIKKAIDNYANVYNSDYFYDFQWHLPYFLTKNNAIGKFVDNGDIWLRYKQEY